MKRTRETFRVVVVPGLQAHDLRPVAGRGAVGLLVAGAGPETSARAAEAMLARGVVRNSLRSGLPTGPVRIRFTRARSIPTGSGFIVVGLPQGGPQQNNRRFAVAVVGGGFRGVLTSPSTRIPGIVSIADIAPTALGEDGGLGSEPRSDPLAELATLDRRIDDHNRWRSRTATWLELALVAVAVVSGTAAVLGAAAFLLANLVLGAVDVPPGVSFAVLLAAALAGLLAVRWRPRPGVVAAFLAAVLGAYLVSFEIDERWVALSPLGPTQNARFYGISNLLETFLLIPSLVGAALLWRRPVLAAGVAGLAFLTIAGSRFGADGGGAIVLAVGFGVLAALLAGAGKRGVVLAAAGAVVLVLGLLGLDAVLGVSSHVTRALEGGPTGLAGDLWDRVTLSWNRVTDSASTAIIDHARACRAGGAHSSSAPAAGADSRPRAPACLRRGDRSVDDRQRLAERRGARGPRGLPRGRVAGPRTGECSPIRAPPPAPAPAAGWRSRLPRQVTDCYKAREGPRSFRDP